MAELRSVRRVFQSRYLTFSRDNHNSYRQVGSTTLKRVVGSELEMEEQHGNFNNMKTMSQPSFDSPDRRPA